MPHIHQASNLYTFAAEKPSGEGWETVSTEAFNALRAGGFNPSEFTQVLAVTPWQMLCALNQLGLRNAVEAAVAAADQNTKDAWNRATRFPRNSPLLAGVATSTGMNDAQLDDLFRLAATFQ